MQPLIQLDKLTVGYHRQPPVLKQVDLAVESGQFIGLIGPNGCGKSTLIRSMAGVLPPQQGTIRLHGQPIDQLGRRQIARQIAVVPQESGVRFAFSVEQTVAMGRHPYLGRWQQPGVADKQAVQEALGQTHTQQLAQRSILALSGGERQRVGIARALAQSPQLLLLDEPTSHLDINHQVEIFELLRHLNRQQGLSIVCATHDLGYAARYCQRLVLLDQGKIVAEGPPEQVLTAAAIEQVYHVAVQVERAGPDGDLQVFPRRGIGKDWDRDEQNTK
ncbi:MAG: heme ABC transporter ATP-binding protein [Candidatus Latescibacteria bacterium]|nr:heme ABC transporter ATP-binding protein [Candidatus Latescibacterota bacterium]